MPTYPIFYTIQNDKDSTTNVFSLSFNEEKHGSSLKLRHIISEFPIDLENENYHIRFKIQCNEIEPKIFAWIDPSNLDARAPIINNAVYMKILHLPNEGDSKLYNKSKILKVKQTKNNNNNSSINNNNNVNGNNKEGQHPNKHKQVNHSNIHHSNSDSDLVHARTNKISEIQNKETKNSQFKQKSSHNLEQQQQKQQQQQPQKQQQPTKTKDLFDDDEDDYQNNIPVKNENKQPQQKSENVDFFGSDDEESQQGQSTNNNNNVRQVQQVNVQNNQYGDDLLGDDIAPSSQQQGKIIGFEKHENLIVDHNQAPQSDFDRIVKSREPEYIINGVMDVKRLIEIKKETHEYLAQLLVDQNKEIEDKKVREQEQKKDAKERLQQKVNNWKEQNGTRKDIRTLLSTLQNVLWTGANWVPVSFFDLSTEESLKSTIKKVLVKFHPDRNRDNIDNKFICEQIIDEIKQAQKDYESKQPK